MYNCTELTKIENFLAQDSNATFVKIQELFTQSGGNSLKISDIKKAIKYKGSIAGLAAGLQIALNSDVRYCVNNWSNIYKVFYEPDIEAKIFDEIQRLTLPLDSASWYDITDLFESIVANKTAAGEWAGHVLHKLEQEGRITKITEHGRPHSYRATNPEPQQVITARPRTLVRDTQNFIASYGTSVTGDIWEFLLADHTTGKHLTWPGDGGEIQTEDLRRLIPKALKTTSEVQTGRKYDRAEIYTPLWIVNKMNSVIDEAIFNRESVFNTTSNGDHDWEPVTEPVSFDGTGSDWKDYVDKTWLEVSCGEGPFITSRYDPVTGEEIPVNRRVGFLDRKLRIVAENIPSKPYWLKVAYSAFMACYGVDIQGDALLIARLNMLWTFIENARLALGRDPLLSELRDVANIISWNVIQMDFLTKMTPGTDKQALIMDWRAGNPVTFASTEEPETHKASTWP